MDLEVGKAYFDIGCSMHGSDVPVIYTYIFIDKDVFGGEKGEYFFQSLDSFFKYGIFPEITDRKIRSKAEVSVIVPELLEGLHDIKELSDSLLDLKTKSPNSFGVISGRPS